MQPPRAASVAFQANSAYDLNDELNRHDDQTGNNNFRENDPFSREPQIRRRLDSAIASQDFSANTIHIPQSALLANNFQPLGGPAQASESSYADHSVAREYRGGKSYMFFVLPILVVIAGLIALSATLLTSKETAQSFSRLLYPNLSQPAPAGVRIDSPSLTKLQLDSGEQVYLVSAKLFNGSEKLIKSATIEVAAFDASDQMVSRSLVSLGNSLTKAYIKSLSPEIIHQLQTQSSNRQSSAVSVGKDREFVIALNDGKQTPAINSIKSYSVRVSAVVL